MNNLNKVVLGLIVGAILGAIDGLTASLDGIGGKQLAVIVMYSSMKGLFGGVVCGLVARKTNSMALALGVGVVVAFGLAHLAAINANGPNGEPIYWRIVLPGMLVGLICGYAAMRYGKAPSRSRSAAA